MPEFEKFLSEFTRGAEIQDINIGCSGAHVTKITKQKKNYFLKSSKNPSIKVEYDKLKWLAGKLPVPQIVNYGEQNGVNYLLTAGLEGEMVCTPYYVQHQDLGLSVIMDAFNTLKKVDVSNCPFNMGLDYRLATIKSNLDNNLINPRDVRPDIFAKYGSLWAIYDYLVSNRPVEEMTFSHGDTSLPNIFGRGNVFTGFIDVAECGVADYWYDIAITAKSIKRNYGDDATTKFYERLNRKINHKSIDYYITLVELCL